MLALAGMMYFSACSSDDDGGSGGTNTTPVENQVIVSANITADTTWTNENIYVLASRIVVEDGATLTIQPGTIVKAQPGTGANAKALIIARGAKIDAQGTADAPIIFTSSADDITIAQVAAGDFKSPNLTPDVSGLWGGLIVLGKARISASEEEVQIEGIPTSDTNGLYGGSDDADNSGIIKYISIRHGGSNIGAGNEINGLSLGGVGSGTVIENVEIVSNADDGIEWFGGTVNVTNALVWNSNDDALDTDQAWSGTCSNFIIVAATGHSFELDGPEGSFGVTEGVTTAIHTFENGTVVASVVDSEGNVRQCGDLINTDSNSGVNIRNVFFKDVVSGQRINRINAAAVTFENIVIDVPAADLAAGKHTPQSDGEDVAITPADLGLSAGSSSSNKADASAFSGWTWASQAGGLQGL